MSHNPKLNKTGAEIHNEPPVAVPANYKRPPTLAEQVRQMCRTHLSRMAQEQGQESWEDADDFEVGDDFDPSSPHELVFDPELEREVPKSIKQDLDAQRKKFDEEITRRKSKKAPPPKPKAKKKPEDDEGDED